MHSDSRESMHGSDNWSLSMHGSDNWSLSIRDLGGNVIGG